MSIQEVVVVEPDALIAGRYRILRRVGAGGMGVVWEGQDERLQRTVAVKQLHPQPGLNPIDADIAKERAMREARITARLHHPYAVSVFDVVEHEGLPCLIMQFVPSTPLSAVLRDRGPLPPGDVARMGAQISSALAAAHRAGIVHRDIKPGNVLIAEDGTARISDFGISHALGDVTLTTTGMVTGTPAFLSPEVARGGDASFASDVFSLGATLYAAVEGTPPFGTGQNSMALLHRVASGDVTPPSRSGPLTPLLLQMLSTDPSQRPSMSEVANALNAELAGGLTATPVLGAAATPGPESQQGRDPQAFGPAQPGPDSDVTKETRRGDPAAEHGFGTRAFGTAAAAEMARPGRPAPGVSPQPPPREPRKRPGVVWAAVAIAVALAAAIASSQLLPLSDETSALPPVAGESAQRSPTEAAATTASPSATPSATRTRSPSPSPTKASSPSPSPSPTRRPRSTPRDDDETTSASDIVAAITNYYALMPEGTDDAWSRMTASYQRNTAGGRSSYERFWNAVDRVTVSDVRGNPPDEAVATVTYFYEDGRVVQERTAYGLVDDDGVLKINTSTVLSSSVR